MAIGDQVPLPPGLRATSAAQSGPGSQQGGFQPPQPNFAAILGQQTPDVSSPGPGNQADGLSQLQMIVQWIEKILPSLGTGTPPHDAALQAARQLSRATGKAGGASLGQQQTLWQQLGQTMQRMGLLAQLNSQRSQGGQQQQQGAGGQPQQAMSTGAPNVSGAFPGA